MPNIAPIELTASEDICDLRRHFSTEKAVGIGAVRALFGCNNRWNALRETGIEHSGTSFINSKNYKGPEATNWGQT